MLVNLSRDMAVRTSEHLAWQYKDILVNIIALQAGNIKERISRGKWLTKAGCLLLRARLALGKAGERPPRPPLCTEESRLCMSEWAPSNAGLWPTAWLRSTWMASSNRSSILFCCRSSRNVNISITEPEKHNLNTSRTFRSTFIVFYKIKFLSLKIKEI